MWETNLHLACDHIIHIPIYLFAHPNAQLNPMRLERMRQQCTHSWLPLMPGEMQKIFIATFFENDICVFEILRLRGTHWYQNHYVKSVFMVCVMCVWCMCNVCVVCVLSVQCVNRTLIEKSFRFSVQIPKISKFHYLGPWLKNFPIFQ